MKYSQHENKYFVRVDKGEEIVTTLAEFCNKRQIKLGKISALGAVDDVEIGVFDSANKQYHSKRFTGTFEILSILGNISATSGKPYLHMHITLTGNDHRAFGGHLNRAVVSATCEVIIEVYEGKLERYFDDDTGLNLFKLK